MPFHATRIPANWGGAKRQHDADVCIRSPGALYYQIEIEDGRFGRPATSPEFERAVVGYVGAHL